VRGERAHSDPRFGEAKPKEFRCLALFGQAESWMMDDLALHENMTGFHKMI